jgi:menaquinone-9 beta-reductase
MQYDVAIIGGGLAGLTLAIQCASQQFSVVLFEKEVYPFHKVCGEYISLESRHFLERLGVELDKFEVPVINALKISDAKGCVYKFNLPLGGFGISRYTLDNTLYKIAESKGVDVFTASRVDEVVFENDVFTIKTLKTTVQAKIVAGCYGKRSNLDIKWKRPFTQKGKNALNNYIGIKYHIKYSHRPSEIALHNFDNGYCGLSKIEDDKSCLCYLTTASNLRNCTNSIDKLQKQVLYKNPRLRHIFENATFIYEEPLAISQISFNKKSQVYNHVLLLGDAAGMITPLCGNGMSMAMHAGKIAYGYISDYLNNKLSREQMELRYANEWKLKFSKRLFIGRTVQRFFGGNTSTTLFLKTMNAVSPLAEAIIRSTHGKPF